MRRCLLLAIAITAMSSAATSFCESPGPVLDPKSIYITSHFDCPVYWNSRQIAWLRNGTRARIVRSAKKWILVTFRGEQRYITGWIKR